MKQAALAFSVAAVLSAQTAPAGGSSIVGTVTDEKGSPVAAAIVTANLQQTTGSPLASNALSDDQGQFEIDNLPAGTYLMCAEAGSKFMLNPCTWSDQQFTATVDGSTPTTGVGVGMTTGITLKIRLHDPQKLLTKTGLPDDVLIGAGHGAALFAVALKVDSDDIGRNLKLVVPADTTIQLSVYSSAFALGDANGNAFTSKSIKIPVKTVKGQDVNLKILVLGTVAL